MTDPGRGQYPPSPVPSDAGLAPGELPFTAFGQFGEGHWDIRALEQDVWWVDRQGVSHLLTEMDDRYHRAVIAFVQADAPSLQATTARRYALMSIEHCMAGRLDDSRYDMMVAKTIMTMSPGEWLESTTLVRKLRELTEGVEGVRP